MSWWGAEAAGTVSPEEATHQIIHYVQNGPSWTAWAIFLSAFVGVLSIAQHRIMAKKRAAYDFILTTREKEHKDAEQVFLELVAKDDLKRILTAVTSGEIKEKLDVQNYVNSFELLAVSIKQNIVDENVCKAVFGDKLVKRWKEAKPLIDEIRTVEKDDEFFEHFEDIATRWKNNPTIDDGNWLFRLLKEVPRI